MQLAHPLCCILLICLSADLAQARQRSELKPLPKDLEIEFALSALPAHLRDEATVYVLDPKVGFEVERRGSNGFHAFVSRLSPMFIGAPWKLTRYPDDIFAPISFDAAGVDSQMKILFDIAAMRARGMAPQELQEIMNQRSESGYYKPPARTGVAYMLSPMLRAYADPMQGDEVISLNIPHYMFYAPNVTDEDIGGRPASPHGFILDPGPFGYIIMVAGESEKEAINQEYEDSLRRLREFDEVYSFENQPQHPSLSERQAREGQAR